MLAADAFSKNAFSKNAFFENTNYENAGAGPPGLAVPPGLAPGGAGAHDEPAPRGEEERPGPSHGAHEPAVPRAAGDRSSLLTDGAYMYKDRILIPQIGRRLPKIFPNNSRKILRYLSSSCERFNY